MKTRSRRCVRLDRTSMVLCPRRINSAQGCRTLRALTLCRLGTPLCAFAAGYSGLPWCCTQSGMSEPAENVLGCHAPQRRAHGIIEPRPSPRLGSTDALLDLREHLLDRGVVWAVRR